MKFLCTIAVVAALALALNASAAEKRPVTALDLWAIKPALSPDGRMVVFTVQEWSVEKNKSTTNLWVVDLTGGQLRRLT